MIQNKKIYHLCLGTILKDFTVDKLKKNKTKQKNGLIEYFNELSVIYNNITASDFVNIHKYLRENDIVK